MSPYTPGWTGNLFMDVETNVNDWNQGMKEFAERIGEPLYRTAQRVAAFAVDVARQAVAVDTGKLQASIRYDLHRSRTEAGFELIADAPKDSAPAESYALYQERGTRYMPAHPYFSVAMDQVENLMYDVLLEEFAEHWRKYDP